LFDQVIIRSVRLRELPFLVRAFGPSGLITAFESGMLRLSSEFTSLIENIEMNGVSRTPPDHFTFGIAEALDREEILRSELGALRSISGLKNEQRSIIEEAAWSAMVRPSDSFGAGVQSQVEHDLRTNTPALRASLLLALKEQGIRENVAASRLDLSIEETSPRIFRVIHNVPEVFGIPIGQSRRIVRRAVSGAAAWVGDWLKWRPTLRLPDFPMLKRHCYLESSPD
jgi:hypothetical protein